MRDRPYDLIFWFTPCVAIYNKKLYFLRIKKYSCVVNFFNLHIIIHILYFCGHNNDTIFYQKAYLIIMYILICIFYTHVNRRFF